MKTRIIALHGFLGEPADWAPVFREIHEQKPDWDLQAPDLREQSSLSLTEWAQNFCAWVKALPPARNTLVGYSMGGRLGLHALQIQPELWQAAVFLSTNPGLRSAEEKWQRLQTDQQWAADFRTLPFNEVLQRWQAQPVFHGAAAEPNRRGQESFREPWAQIMENWSLGRQIDFREHIDLWDVRQIWAAGTKDAKFIELLRSLPARPEIQKWEVEDVAHRLPFEAPSEVAHFALRASMPIPLI
jgi:2-succinyl-6-hydroxy-2,4-cyclohexadiene-1-carboxylate synthase